jgi:hypothetical protein
MIREQISLQEVIGFLNQLVLIDHDAIRLLIETRVMCNQALADHPTVQVQAREEMDGIPGEVGVLGVLNGMFGVDDEGWGPIAACFEVVCPTHGKVEGNGIVGDTCQVDVSQPAEGLGLGGMHERLCGEPLELGKLTHFKETKKRDGNLLL